MAKYPSSFKFYLCLNDRLDDALLTILLLVLSPSRMCTARPFDHRYLCSYSSKMFAPFIERKSVHKTTLVSSKSSDEPERYSVLNAHLNSTDSPQGGRHSGRTREGRLRGYIDVT
ncbi:hypothetical protein BDW22DRAFT_16295 [Trametopsis cervina]|nr:hypothetical protein BDW22DRAFT_16295 [Trametopsis cervina]